MRASSGIRASLPGWPTAGASRCASRRAACSSRPANRWSGSRGAQSRRATTRCALWWCCVRCARLCMGLGTCACSSMCSQPQWAAQTLQLALLRWRGPQQHGWSAVGTQAGCTYAGRAPPYSNGLQGRKARPPRDSDHSPAERASPSPAVPSCPHCVHRWSARRGRWQQLRQHGRRGGQHGASLLLSSRTWPLMRYGAGLCGWVTGWGWGHGLGTGARCITRLRHLHTLSTLDMCESCDEARSLCEEEPARFGTTCPHTSSQAPPLLLKPHTPLLTALRCCGRWAPLHRPRPTQPTRQPQPGSRCSGSWRLSTCGAAEPKQLARGWKRKGGTCLSLWCCWVPRVSGGLKNTESAYRSFAVWLRKGWAGGGMSAIGGAWNAAPPVLRAQAVARHCGRVGRQQQNRPLGPKLGQLADKHSLYSGSTHTLVG